jgi:hypothetical protein
MWNFKYDYYIKNATGIKGKKLPSNFVENVKEIKQALINDFSKKKNILIKKLLLQKNKE